jgi:uncharacterized membrane protein YhaH (DUF805 family)
MGSFSLFHWIIVFLIMAIFAVPTVRILRKAGYSGWWVLISLIPVINIVGFWCFAFMDWPALKQRPATT